MSPPPPAGGLRAPRGAARPAQVDPRDGQQPCAATTPATHAARTKAGAGQAGAGPARWLGTFADKAAPRPPGTAVASAQVLDALRWTRPREPHVHDGRRSGSIWFLAGKVPSCSTFPAKNERYRQNHRNDRTWRVTRAAPPRPPKPAAYPAALVTRQSRKGPAEPTLNEPPAPAGGLRAPRGTAQPMQGPPRHGQQPWPPPPPQPHAARTRHRPAGRRGAVEGGRPEGQDLVQVIWVGVLVQGSGQEKVAVLPSRSMATCWSWEPGASSRISMASVSRSTPSAV